MNRHLITYFVGIFIVFASHLTMLISKAPGPKTHAYVNLLAAMLIAYYFMNKEQYISF
jgi:quinol-cytochrome oxidoreductase complex cytochrome b subunit